MNLRHVIYAILNVKFKMNVIVRKNGSRNNRGHQET